MVFSTRSVTECYKQGQYQASQFRRLMQTVRLFNAVAMIFREMREFRGAESEEDRMMVITKTHEAEWTLEFIRGKYDCAGEVQRQL
jgi:hypothetical protein